MMATPAPALPTGAGWTYEVKWDGYRTLAVRDRGRARLYSRNLRDATAHFAEVSSQVDALPHASVILDGEVVALDERGRPSFQALHHNAARVLVFYAFDLLHLDGRDLTALPLDERRALLRPAIEGSALLLSDALPGTPRQIERAVRRLGLEGVLAKRAGSRYEPGRRSAAWVKVRFSNRQEFVIGGYKPGGANFDSLLVGYYDAGKLMFAGKVRAGLTPYVRAALFERFDALRSARCPFANLPTNRTSHWGEGITREEMADLRWLKPTQVAEVSFTEWTRDGNLRHAAFVGIRTDKPPRSVRRET